MAKKKKFPEPKGGWEYIPKGSMCIVCTHFEDNCSNFDFNKMPSIEMDEKFKVVKCSHFEKDDVQCYTLK